MQLFRKNDSGRNFFDTFFFFVFLVIHLIFTNLIKFFWYDIASVCGHGIVL